MLLKVSPAVHDLGLVTEAISGKFTTTSTVPSIHPMSADVHQGFFDSYNVGTMYAGIAYSYISTNLQRNVLAIQDAGLVLFCLPSALMKTCTI
jgi:hypothetical protein